MLVEIATFRLAPGVSEEDFLAADKAVQEAFFHHQAGLVRRTTARGKDGSWAVITLWGSTGDADAAAAALTDDPTGGAFGALIDEASLAGRRYETLD